MGRKSNSNLCMVCESPKAINQFGAMACRACGAFFRRLIASNRQYYCDCDLRLREKVETENARKQRISNCRGCRMRRCFGAGMKIESKNYTNNNDNIIVKVEPQQIDIFTEDDQNHNYIKQLLDIQEKAFTILLNVRGFGNNFLEQFETFEQLIQSNDNLLAHSEYYRNRPIEYFDKKAFEENVSKYGLFSQEPHSLIKLLLLSIDIAKTLPAFSRLNLSDQVISVGGFVAASSILIGRFNSLTINAETDVIEIIDYPVVKLFTNFTNCKEPVIKNLAEAVFDLPMKHFRQICPSKEEFVLILALLFTNSTTPSLSKYGQGIMNAETEKYAKILLRFQQRQFGDQKGALRFSECLQLLWNAISSVQKHRELIVYMDSVYEQGRFDKIMPKILAHLVV